MRNVIVTGGGTGIGLATARRFAAAGDRVAVCSRNPAHLESARAGIAGEVFAAPCDIRERQQIDDLVSRVVGDWGPVHVLVCNAGAGARTPIEEEADDLIREMMETNVIGTLSLIRRVVRDMPEGGRIVTISSVLGKFGVAASSAYCASKHAVIGLTRALALELAPRRITVNAVCPGWVDTQMANENMQQLAALDGVSFDAFKEAALSCVPIGRFVDPREIASMIFYLASADAAAVTGQAVNVCGGQSFY